VKPLAEPVIKRRFSVTTDIVGYRRCPRQYGAIHVHQYAPSRQTQLYFGTILHQVLDRCHAWYHGDIDPSTKGQIPDGGRVLSDAVIADFFDDAKEAVKKNAPAPPPPSDIVRFFVEVEDGLISQGIRAITPDLRLKAVRILQYFNTLEGPVLYPRVRDTEHRLQADQQSHILHGVVDLLIDAADGGFEAREIWDYKGTSRITLTKSDLETYLFQMRVYAHLYSLKHGRLPRKVILYFLSELDGPTCPARRPVNATLELNEKNGLGKKEIQDAMKAFHATVQAIEQDRQRDVWDPAPPGGISDQDCALCDLKWDCPTPNGGKGVKLQYP
jgi:putative RecB family exonuclease